MKQLFLKHHKKMCVSYFALPALVGLAVAAVSVCAPAIGHASTPGCTGLAGTFTQSTTPTTPYNEDGQNGSTTYHCVQYIQQMINGSLAYNRLIKDGTQTINSKALSSVTTFGASTNGFGKVSTTYDAATMTIEKSFQNYVNSFPTGISSKTAIPNGKLRTDGATDKNTMLALCTVAYNLPVSARTVTDSTDFTGGKPNSAASNKTNMWYMRSYMRAGYTAASDAGCASAVAAAVLKTPSEPASISNNAVSPHLTVTWPAVSGATSYNVKILDVSGQNLKRAGAVKVTHAVFSVATSGATGISEVQACNAAGCSSWRTSSKPYDFLPASN